MKNNSRQIILYGLGGPDINYVPLEYYNMFEEDVSIITIRHHAEFMAEHNPTIKEVWAVDNRKGLKHDYMHAIKKHSVDSGVEFRSMLERYAIRIVWQTT